MPLIYRSGARVRRSRKRAPFLWGSVILFTVVVAATWTIWSGRAEALRRLVATVPGQELRYEKWSAVVDHLAQFMPFGSGVGTYEPVFEMIEPASLLAASYSNHAHNDWLEVVLTTGFAGVLLLAVAIVAFMVALTRRILRGGRGSDAAFSLAGLALILMAAIASAVDYPLRTPIVAALFVIACLWARLGHTASSADLGRAAGVPRNGEGNRSEDA
jgi:O-antigen ligase